MHWQDVQERARINPRRNVAEPKQKQGTDPRDETHPVPVLRRHDPVHRVEAARADDALEVVKDLENRAHETEIKTKDLPGNPPKRAQVKLRGSRTMKK